MKAPNKSIGAAYAARALTKMMTAERSADLKARLLRAKQAVATAESPDADVAVRELVRIVADLLDQVEDVRTVLRELSRG